MNGFAFTGQAAEIEDDLIRFRRRKLEFDHDAARARRALAATAGGRWRWQRKNSGGVRQREGSG